jgi:hypothetical protein
VRALGRVRLSGCRRGRGFLFSLLGLVLHEPTFEDDDGGAEVVALGDEQVDIIPVFRAGETVRVIDSGVDRRPHFAAVWAQEAEVAFADLGRRPLAAKRGDGGGHGQVVANLAEQFRRKHGFLQGWQNGRPCPCATQKSTRSDSFCQWGCISTRLTLSMSIVVPVRIVVAYFAKLDLYGFWAVEELFTEFLRILDVSERPN